MKHTFETKVYYFDTDAYNIVWHGAYLKWFEMGRIDYFSMLNEDLDKLKAEQVQFPVVNISARYKAPARFGDVLLTTTTIDNLTKFSIKFKHDIINKVTGQLLVIGYSEVVTTNLEGKLLRKMPEYLHEKFSNCLLAV